MLAGALQTEMGYLTNCVSGVNPPPLNPAQRAGGQGAVYVQNIRKTPKMGHFTTQTTSEIVHRHGLLFVRFTVCNIHILTSLVPTFSPGQKSFIDGVLSVFRKGPIGVSFRRSLKAALWGGGSGGSFTWGGLRGFLLRVTQGILHRGPSWGSRTGVGPLAGPIPGRGGGLVGVLGGVVTNSPSLQLGFNKKT